MTSRDLFVSLRDLFVNLKNFLVIFNPTNAININDHHFFLPVNSLPWGRGEDFWPLAYLLSCLFGLLSFSS